MVNTQEDGGTLHIFDRWHVRPLRVSVLEAQKSLQGSLSYENCHCEGIILANKSLKVEVLPLFLSPRHFFGFLDVMSRHQIETFLLAALF